MFKINTCVSCIIMLVLLPLQAMSKNINYKNSHTISLYAKGEVIVVLKKGKTIQDMHLKVSKSNINIAKKYKTISSKKNRLYMLVKGDMSTQELVLRLKANPNIKSVSPNYRRKLNISSTDPRFSDMWGLQNIGQKIKGSTGTYDADIDAPEAWSIETNASDTVVAIFDTGVDYNHEDLRSNIWINSAEYNGIIGIDDDDNGYIDDIYGYDFASDNDGNDDSDPMDIHGHGTHIAGTVSASTDNGVGTAGVGQHTKIMPIKVFRPDLGSYDSDVLEAIDYILVMKSRGVNVVAINASYGELAGNQTDPMNGAINSLGDAGIVFVTAAGNDDVNTDARPHYPSSYSAPNILSVAATDKNDKLASFSNFGTNSVDLAAPGVDILSTYPGEGEVDGSIFFDDVESGVGKWITSGTNNTWAITGDDFNSSIYSWTDSPNSKYENNTNSSLSYNEDIDLTLYTREPIGLSLCMIYELEKGHHSWMLWDKVFIEISADSGNSWSVLQELGDRQNKWKCIAYAIPEEFKTAFFRMRFRISTDESVVLDGIYIDDISIGKLSPSKRYGYSSGTSMASPHVAGTIALLAAHYPYENTEYRVARVLGGVDHLNTLNQKVLSKGRLNIFKSLELDLTEPTGVDDNVRVNEDSNITIYILENDIDADRSKLKIVDLTTPSHGSLGVNGLDITYIPNPNFYGIDSFKYRPSNGLLSGEETSVTITVTSINDIPIAIDDSVSVNEDSNITITPLNNDIDIDNDILNIVNINQPINGKTIVSDNSIIYIPHIGFSGNDRFSYTISDGVQTSNGTVYILVIANNDKPVAKDINVTIDEDSSNNLIVLRGVYTDSNILSYIIVSNPNHGTLSGTVPNIIYTPNLNFYGVDKFTYKVKDGTIYSEVATVSISITSDGNSEDASSIMPNELADTNDSLPIITSSNGGGCSYNPNSNNFDFMMILMLFASILYPFKRKNLL